MFNLRKYWAERASFAARFAYIKNLLYLCTLFLPNGKKTMNETLLHMDSTSVPESPVTQLFRSVAGMMQERDVEVYQLKQERDYYKDQQKELPQVSIVAEGVQTEFIAIANAMYARGMVKCSKKEFMQRLADALGCPAVADYSRPLNKVKQTYKYQEIFDDLKKVAIEERDKNDN